LFRSRGAAEGKESEIMGEGELGGEGVREKLERGEDVEEPCNDDRGLEESMAAEVVRARAPWSWRSGGGGGRGCPWCCEASGWRWRWRKGERTRAGRWESREKAAVIN
jgi:hypothetical protein